VKALLQIRASFAVLFLVGAACHNISTDEHRSGCSSSADCDGGARDGGAGGQSPEEGGGPATGAASGSEAGGEVGHPPESSGGSLASGGSAGFVASSGGVALSNGGVAVSSGGTSSGGTLVGSGGLEPDTAGAGGVDADPEQISNCREAISFSPTTNIPIGGRPCQVAATDLDADARLDLLVADCDNSNLKLLRGQLRGSFADPVAVPATYAVRSFAIGDLDGDGSPDLAVATGMGNVGVLLNRGSGNFDRGVFYPVGTSSHRIAIADLDGDGAADLAVTNLAQPPLSVLYNLGDGTFSEAVEPETGFLSAAGWDVEIADVNRDQAPDLFVFVDGGVAVGMNAGDGTFATWDRYLFSTRGLGSSAYTWKGALGDFNSDGALDIAGGGPVSVLLNDGDGIFADAIEYDNTTTLLFPVDIDADGNVDLVAGPATVLLNRFPDRRFSEFVSVQLSNNATDVACPDLNGDGLPDLVFTQPNEGLLTLFLTQCGAE
jgi:hypothetical protein